MRHFQPQLQNVMFASATEYILTPALDKPHMSRTSDEIEYNLIGDDLQAVVVTLDPGEQMIGEAGTMLYMTDGVDMQTSMSLDKNRGFFGNLIKAVGRVVTGESFFVTTYTNTGSARADVAFASPYPGKIIPVNLKDHNGELLCEKNSFLCAARGIDMSVALQRKLGAGFFGGEGFVLQRLKGDGMAFIHAGGTVLKKELKAGEMLRVDTGCVAAFEPSVSFDIQFVGGIKNALFGGEGLWFATLRGPGSVYLQTLPFSRLADRIIMSSGLGSQKTGESGFMSSLMGDRN